MSAVIFSGNNVKTLKPNIDLYGFAQILAQSSDPTFSAVNATTGSLLLSDNGHLYQKQDDGLTTNWKILATANPNDVKEQTYAIGNNITIPNTITNLHFDNTLVRSFEIVATVVINAATSLYETFNIKGIYKGSAWTLVISSIGDNSQINFSILPAGIVQYTSGNYPSFTSANIRFKASTLSL